MKFFNFVFFAILGFGFAGTGQGIGNGSDGLESEEIADSVKQEVFLKTAEAEPIHLDRFKRFDGIGGGASPSRHSGGIGDGVAPRPGNSGIGGGASPTRGHRHGSSEIGDGVEPNRRSGIGGGAEPSHRSGIGSGTTHTRAPNKPEAHSGIGSGASSDWAPNKPRKGKWQIAENEDVSHIIHNDLIQVARKPRFSRDDRFDSGYNKDCNSYYGRLICYRIYSNPNIRVPGEMTCWRISGNRKNCTEIDNINYLRDEGYTAYESEVPRTRNHRPQQTEQITHGQDQYYDPYNTNQNYNGADRYPKTGNSQRGTHRFSTKALTLNDDSLEDDDTVELVRDKRKSGGKNTFRVSI